MQIMETTQCMLLSEKDHSEEATYRVIANTWQYGKGKIIR